MLHVLKNYSPKNDKHVTLKNNLVNNASNFYKKREQIIEGFKNEVFSFYYDKDHEEQTNIEKEEEEQEEEQEKEQEKIKTDMNEISKYIAKEETDINEELFKKTI